jgi:hypothetical protein
MDADNVWVPTKLDTGGERYYWQCKKCPRNDDCSTAAWAKVKSWSFKTEDAVRDAVHSHLVNSGKHHLDEADAKLAVESCEIVFQTESPHERAAFNTEKVKQQKAKKDADTSQTMSPKPQPREPPHEPRAPPPHMKPSAKNQPRALQGGRGSSSSQGGDGAIGGSSAIVRSKRPFDGNDQKNSQRLRMMMDSVDRARLALQSAQKMFTNAAEKFQERSLACTQAAGALQDEQNIMIAGRECLADMARDMS